MTVESNEIVWSYPPTDDDSEGIGYAAIRFDGLMRRERLSPVLQFRFNSTVGGIASSEPYKGYKADWFRFRVGPPSEYEAMSSYELRIQPPPWPAFSARYGQRGGRRELVVKVPDINSRGTVQVPFVLDQMDDAPPEQLHCSFTAQASRPGVLGKKVRVVDQGTLEFGGT